jgi:hypothetical protein
MKTIEQIQKEEYAIIRGKDIGFKIIEYHILGTSNFEFVLYAVTGSQQLFQGRWGFSRDDLTHRQALLQLLAIIYAEFMRGIQNEDYIPDSHLLPLDCWLEEHWGIELTEDESHEYL